MTLANDSAALPPTVVREKGAIWSISSPNIPQLTPVQLGCEVNKSPSKLKTNLFCVTKPFSGHTFHLHSETAPAPPDYQVSSPNNSHKWKHPTKNSLAFIIQPSAAFVVTSIAICSSITTTPRSNCAASKAPTRSRNTNFSNSSSRWLSRMLRTLQFYQNKIR